MTLGQNIQNARRAQGLSQEALAEKIGVSRQALGKWEKDTALPGLDNLQALAAALGIGVDALLGAENADPAVPAVTLDALRDLLAARDAEEKHRRRLWGCAGGVAFIVLAGLLAGVALQYERQIETLRSNTLMQQSYYDTQQQELNAKIEELQKDVRMGETTVTDWRWLPVDKLHRDADKSWMPVQVQVTPRTTRDGVTARLAVRCGDDTQLYEMTAAPDGSFAADGIVFTVGSSLDFGYSVRRVGNKQYRLTLTCYPVEVQVDAPPWMQPAQVEIDLRLNGDAGEPTATAVLDCEGESSYGNSSRTESVWNGTFYSDDVVNGWEYDGETLPKYVVRVTDTNGNVWTEEMPLSKR